MRWWARFVSAALLMQIIHAKFFMEFLYFGNCKDNSGLPYHVENSSYGMVSSGQSEFNSTLVIERDFPLLTIKAKIFECKTMNEGECEFLVTITDHDHCSRMLEKGQFWSIFSDAAHPPITCPLKKGTHQIIKARLPMGTLSKLPVSDNSVYKLDFVYEEHGKLVGCWRARVKKHRLRNRKN